MTPETKAKEIVGKYRGMACEEIQDDETLILYTICGHLAKSCAIIHVNGIIDVLEWFGYTGTMYDHPIKGRCQFTEETPPEDFWKDVLNEINKI